MAEYAYRTRKLLPDPKPTRRVPARAADQESRAASGLLGLQRAAGNRATLLAIGQAKTMVGASNDPLEHEADRIAAEVVALLNRPPQASAIAQRALSGSRPDPIVSRRAVGPEGGSLDEVTGAAITAARSGGEPLSPQQRSHFETAFGGADFGAVRLHAGSQAEQLNRAVSASAFTIGEDIFFRDGLPDTAARPGQSLLAHELTHTLQQGGTSTIGRMHAAEGEIIRRHSSWEHQLLGDLQPKELAALGAWKDLIAQTNTRFGKKQKTIAEVDVDFGAPTGVVKFKKADVLHVLVTELSRLDQWQKQPPKQSDTAKGDTDSAQLDAQNRVMTVRLPQGLLVTYGEMNTLADFYGSEESLRSADAKNVWQILQSVRQETFLRLRDIYTKVAGSLTKAENKSKDVRTATGLYNASDFDPDPEGYDPGRMRGAVTPDYISGMAGQLDLLLGFQKTGASGQVNKYGAGLGRNACHFVPESWHAWADQHNKARDLAAESYRNRTSAKAISDQLAQGLLDPDGSRRATIDRRTKRANSLANDAMLANGFGDHYLQDSYASGHMINKSQIMQWYVEYLDQHPVLGFDYHRDKNWRKVQNVAYTQDLGQRDQYDRTEVQGYGPGSGGKAMNPQSVENRGQSWEDNFEDLGLKIPDSLGRGLPSRQFFEWWQSAAKKGRHKTGAQLKQARGGHGLAPQAVEAALVGLVGDGVVRTSDSVSTRGKFMAKYRDSKSGGAAPDFDDFDKADFYLRDNFVPKGKRGAALKDDDLDEEIKKVVYKDYDDFLSSGFIQKATNALHDQFCKNGLTVLNDLSQTTFMVYGDDRMFKEGASAGVEHSGTTARMSRNAIVNLIQDGKDNGETVKGIMDRLPSKVSYDLADGTSVTDRIEDWHDPARAGALKEQCFKTTFPKMNWSLTQKLAPGVNGRLGKRMFTAKPPHPVF